MKKISSIICILSLIVVFPKGMFSSQTTALWLRGYGVIPTPRQVELKEGDVYLDRNWNIELDGISQDDIAVKFLLSDLKNFYNINLAGKTKSNSIIQLEVKPGTVKTNTEPAVDEQGYRLVIDSTRITLSGNSRSGLFYGVQTLLQLIKSNVSSGCCVPVCTITDWPSLQLRILHWDVKHHQDRIETLKRYLDWAARFKINGIGWELEDKFAYPSHPIIGAPGAFSPEQIQEIIDYGLERHIQVIPQVQAPAHMTYVLKHSEFAHLRSDSNNYQACLCDERTYELIFSMYDDLIKASQGIDYFFVSTDEVYYAGICSKCERPYNEVNRSLAWTEFVNRAHEFVTERGRTMLCWVEYPLLAEHIKLLPSDIIDAIIGREWFIEEENKRGIRQMAYVSMQGSEKLFPNLFAYVEDGRPFNGRLSAAFEISNSGKAWKGNPIGAFIASWDDSGLHNETFWLGWATGAQYAWTPGTPSIEQSVSEFMRIYYGPEVSDMVEIYRGLQNGARFWENSWDRIPTRERPRAYGNSKGKGVGGERYDYSLAIPNLPKLPDLSYQSFYREKYTERLEKARVFIKKNDQLIYRIQENMAKAVRNRYNLEVFLALADFQRHHLKLLIGLGEIERLLYEACLAASDGDSSTAVQRLKDANQKIGAIIKDGKTSYENLKVTYERSRYPKGRSIDGKHFVHIMDNVKDHLADRRPDLRFMIASEQGLELLKWQESLAQVISGYTNGKK